MPLKVEEHKLIAPYTLYKIGGPARFYAEVCNEEELKEALRFAQKENVPFFILGAGSNVLVSDEGYEGMLIRRRGGHVAVDDMRLIADADVMMAQVATSAAHAGLSGLEWAIGIPGTVGGSVRGNSGCFGGEMKDAIESVRVFLFPELAVRNFSNNECGFSYRDSAFKRHPERIIVSATFFLHARDTRAIQERILEISRARAVTQDIGTKCAGCIFKNVLWENAGADKSGLIVRFPELGEFSDRTHIPASFLLDHAGLKKKRVGHVVISPVHANFFVNEGGGSAEEVKKLIDTAKEEVMKKYGIEIEEEIQYVGFFF